MLKMRNYTPCKMIFIKFTDHLLLKSPSKALLAVYVSVYALADILIPSSETYSVPATTSVQTLGIISPFFNTG